jgi:DNA-binding NtrC family response regulator
MLRAWPGNVRELLAEAKRAAAAAKAAGATEAQQKHLADTAGMALEAAPLEDVAKRTPAPDDEAIKKALEAAGGNVTKAARDLGMHRTQLRRWIAKNKEP